MSAANFLPASGNLLRCEAIKSAMKAAQAKRKNRPRAVTPTKESALPSSRGDPLSVRAQASLAKFLRNDLRLGCTVVRSAKLYRSMGGDTAQYEKQKRLVLQILRTAARFEGLLPPEQEHEINTLKKQLAAANATL
jgi:hypothetical protein